jgi:hypothetical protein
VALAAPSAASGWAWPVQGPVLRAFRFDSDPYGAGLHRGIDLGAPSGAVVVAPVSGTVTFAGSVPTAGKTLTIQTGDGYSATLVHLGSLGIGRGAAVTEGDQVGTVGPSGVAELPVPYVHLGVRRTDEPQGYLDPLLFLPPLAVAPPAAPPPPQDPAPSPAPVPAPAPAVPAAPPAPAAPIEPPAPPQAAPLTGSPARLAGPRPAQHGVGPSTAIVWVSEGEPISAGAFGHHSCPDRPGSDDQERAAGGERDSRRRSAAEARARAPALARVARPGGAPGCRAHAQHTAGHAARRSARNAACHHAR